MLHFDAIVEDMDPMTKALLRAARPMVRRRYRAYRTYAPRLERFQISTHQPATQTALLQCYKARNAAYDVLHAAIQRAFAQAGQTYCPYCGLNDAGSIDHYLPQGQFPELAVCHWNLILACMDCNTRFKRAKWHEAGKRLYLHPYFDNIDETRAYLHAAIDIRNDVPTVQYSVVMPLGGDPEFFNHYERHCHGLKLFKRFAHEARRKLDDMRTDLQELTPNDSLQALQRKLDNMATKRSRKRGANHWEVALLRAVASSPAVIQWCLGYAPSRPAGRS